MACGSFAYIGDIQFSCSCIKLAFNEKNNLGAKNMMDFVACP